MDKCRVSQEELLNDIKQFRSNMAEQYQLEKAAIYSEDEQRADVYELADRLILERVTISYERLDNYGIENLMVTVWDHPLFKERFKHTGSTKPLDMQDLITRCARYACAVHLFGESRADELGFIK